MAAIDFGAFTQGARAAKQDYWTDVRESQGALLRDIGVQDGLRQAREAQENEQAAAYLSPMLLDQQKAAGLGVQADDWYQRATNAILNDEGFKGMSPQTQQRVMDKWRAHGVTMSQKLAEAGDPQRALLLSKSMGLGFGPENRADPNQVFDATRLADAGFVNDPATGMWIGPQGQKIPAAQGAYTVLQQGQPGVLSLLTDQAAEQERMKNAVSSGYFVEMVDAQGNRTYRPKNARELAWDNYQEGVLYRQDVVKDAIARGEVDPLNSESVNMWVAGMKDPAYFTAVRAYNQGQTSAAPQTGGAPYTGPMTSPQQPVNYGLNPELFPPARTSEFIEPRAAQSPLLGAEGGQSPMPFGWDENGNRIPYYSQPGAGLDPRMLPSITQPAQAPSPLAESLVGYGDQLEEKAMLEDWLVSSVPTNQAEAETLMQMMQRSPSLRANPDLLRRVQLKLQQEGFMQ